MHYPQCTMLPFWPERHSLFRVFSVWMEQFASTFIKILLTYHHLPLTSRSEGALPALSQSQVQLELDEIQEVENYYKRLSLVDRGQSTKTISWYALKLICQPIVPPQIHHFLKKISLSWCSVHFLLTIDWLTLDILIFSLSLINQPLDGPLTFLYLRLSIWIYTSQLLWLFLILIVDEDTFFLTL